MLEVPLVVSQMDTTPLYDDCAFLKDWPGVPVGNEEGEIISAALGDKRAILLAHHGQLVTGATVEEACNLAVLIERAARLQLLAMSAGTVQPLPRSSPVRPTTGPPPRGATRPTSPTTPAGRCGNHPDCLTNEVQI